MIVDVRTIFLDIAFKTDLIKKIEKFCLRRDLNLSKQFLNHQRTLIHQHFNVIRVQKEKNVLAQRFKNDFDSIKNDSNSLNDI